MDRTQALYSFWSSFGLHAYDEQTVPDGVQMPYITYETAAGDLYQQVALTASIWYRSNSWSEITQKMENINDELGLGGKVVPFEGGALWIKRGSPFAQRVAEPNDDSVRRYFLNIVAEFISAK